MALDEKKKESRSVVKCSCGATLEFSPRPGRTSIGCPKCGQRVPVPSAPTPSAAPAGASPSAATRWFVARNKQKFGPFTWGELKQLAAAGKLQPQDMVLCEGEARWVAAEGVKGLFTQGIAASGSAPKRPAVSAPVPAPVKPMAPALAPTNEELTVLPAETETVASPPPAIIQRAVPLEVLPGDQPRIHARKGASVRNRKSKWAADEKEIGFRCPYCNSNEIPDSRSEIMPIAWWIFIVTGLSCVGLLFGWIALLIFRRKYRQCTECGMHLGAIFGNQ